MLNAMQGSAPAMAMKVAAARIIAVMSSIARHGGTTLPGKVVLLSDKDIISRLGRRYEKGSMIVSATNGKTTTCGMIVSVLGHEGMSVARNREGANLRTGIATTVLRDASMAGRPNSEFGLFEVDEAALPEVAYQCAPGVILLMNLFRDQLDRYGELEHIAGLWRSAIRPASGDTTIILNADDPLVADMASERPGNIIFYGLDDAEAGRSSMQHASDSKFCSRCGSPLEYDFFFVGHLGAYHCPSCGRTRPSPTVMARKIRLRGISGSSFTLVAPTGESRIDIAMPGLYNIYNALAAAAACAVLGIGHEAIRHGLESFSAAFGRVERLTVEGGDVVMLLVKNPAGFNEVVRTLMIEEGPKYLMLALNDRIADGRDISWIWDVDLEPLMPGVRLAVASGDRAEEMAMRLKYAGLETGKMIIRRDLSDALREALSRLPEGETLYVLPTYTAMLAMRKEIHQRFRTDGEMGDLVWK